MHSVSMNIIFEHYVDYQQVLIRQTTFIYHRYSLSFLPLSLPASSEKENWWNFFRFLKLGKSFSKFFARLRIFVAQSMSFLSEIQRISCSSLI